MEYKYWVELKGENIPDSFLSNQPYAVLAETHESFILIDYKNHERLLPKRYFKPYAGNSEKRLEKEIALLRLELRQVMRRVIELEEKLNAKN